MIVLATLIGRLPIGISGLAILLYVREVTGSFAAAGVCAGALALGSALGAPLPGPPGRPPRRRHAGAARRRARRRAAGGLGRGRGGRPGRPCSPCCLAAHRRGDPAGLARCCARAGPTCSPSRPELVHRRVRARLGADRGGLRGRPAADDRGRGDRRPAVRADRVGRLRADRHADAAERPERPARARAERRDGTRALGLGALADPGLRTLVFASLPVGFALGSIEVVRARLRRGRGLEGAGRGAAGGVVGRQRRGRPGLGRPRDPLPAARGAPALRLAAAAGDRAADARHLPADDGRCSWCSRGCRSRR